MSRVHGAPCRCPRPVLTYSGPDHHPVCPRHQALVLPAYMDTPQLANSAHRLGVSYQLVKPWPSP